MDAGYSSARAPLAALCVMVLGCGAAPGTSGDAVPAPPSVPVAGAAEDEPYRASGAPKGYAFAMCSNGNILTNPEYPVKMLDAGARMCRADFTFPAVRKSPGEDPDRWDWSALERMREVRRKHPKLEFLGLLGYGAAWAADPRFGGGISAPQRGIDIMPPESPANLYGHYVHETVRRYKDAITTWESWNEPDLAGHHYFAGSGADFLPYQKACYLAAKKADPECTVLFAGMCYPTFEGYLASHGLKAPSPSPPKASFFEEYLKAASKDPGAKRHGWYFDVMNTHTYSRATDAYDYVAVIRKLMKDHIGDDSKAVWITEMGSTDKGGLFGGTPDEYCDYVLQSFAWGALAGVDRFFHFQLDNSNGHGLYSGMLGGPKPALVTYRDVLVKELAGAHLVKQLHGSAGVGFLEGKSPFTGGGRDGWDAFDFRRDDGARVVMAFADTAKPVEVKLPAFSRAPAEPGASGPATKARATLVDRHGKRTEIAARGGAYEIELAGATNVAGWPTADDPKAKALGEPEHLVGGATVLVVEEP